MRLEVGLTPWSAEGISDSLVAQAELAEELGFDSFWLPESHFLERANFPAPLLPLAAIAARTQRLRLGTTSYLLPIRHPVQVAEEVAVLDQLSGGRVILGVGRGFRPALFQTFDVPPQEKRDRFEASLQIMQRAWRGEPVAYENETSPIHHPLAHSRKFLNTASTTTTETQDYFDLIGKKNPSISRVCQPKPTIHVRGVKEGHFCKYFFTWGIHYENTLALDINVDLSTGGCTCLRSRRSAGSHWGSN